MFDRKVYFDLVRDSPFPGKLSQQQVDGQNAILTLWEHQYSIRNQRWLAYMLATTYHETAYTMWPIEEYGKGAGKEYGKADPETGQTYYGRGFVQLTWRDNYERATKELALEDADDLVWHAEQALDLTIASEVLFEGMIEGWFTGKKLGDFFSETVNDPTGARIIINNDVSKNGAKVAGYHEDFLAAVRGSWAVPVAAVTEYKLLVEAPVGVTVNVTLVKL